MTISSKKSICVGLDVHKNNEHCCVAGIRKGTNGKSELKFYSKKFGSSRTELSNMCRWIREIARDKFGLDPENLEQPIDVYMESTGKYSTPVYNVCEELGMNPHVLNPKHVRTISGQKTDQKDACWIAQLGFNGLLRASYIPSRIIRDAKSISRARTKIVQNRADDERRIRNILTEANVRIDLIFSGVTTESARNVIFYLMSTDEPKLEEVKKLIRKSCNIMKYKDEAERKQKEEELLKAFDGAKFSSSQKDAIRMAYARIDEYSDQIRDYEIIMAELLEPFKRELDLLETIPGISHLSAMQIICETGPDMSPFENEKRFISWCGLCPASNQSNNKHKSVKIGKGGYYLKPVLIQCALNAVKHPYYKKKYESISARRGKKRALIAIARKMMVAAYHMIISGEKFRPTDQAEVCEETAAIPADPAEAARHEEKEQKIEETVQEIVEISKGEKPELIYQIRHLFEQLEIPAPVSLFESQPISS